MNLARSIICYTAVIVLVGAISHHFNITGWDGFFLGLGSGMFAFITINIWNNTANKGDK